MSKGGTSKSPSVPIPKSASKDKKKSEEAGSKKKTSKRRIEDSSDDDKSPIKKHVPKKINLSNLASPKDEKPKKAIDVKNIFGNNEIVRVPKKKAEKIPEKSVVDDKDLFDSDEDLLMKSVIDLEDSFIKQSSDEKNESSSENSKKSEKNPCNNVISDKSNASPDKKSLDKLVNNITKISPDDHKQKPANTIEISNDDKIEETQTKNKSERDDGSDKNEFKKINSKQSTDHIIPATPENINKGRKSSSSKSSKLNESTAQDDEDRHERKRLAGILYQKYKNRTSVINPGSKPLPQVIYIFILKQPVASWQTSV